MNDPTSRAGMRSRMHMLRTVPVLLLCLAATLLVQATATAQVTEERLRAIEEAHRREMEAMRAEFQRQTARLRERIAELESTADHQQSGEKSDAIEALIAEAEQEAARGASRNSPLSATQVSRPNALNPRITLFSDTVGHLARGTFRNEDGDDVADRFSLRESELDFRADVDPYAKGVFIFAVEEVAPNEFEFAAEEVYVTFEALPFGLRLKAGRFRTALGVNNILHTHDLPHTNRPLAVATFLGEEGDVENGVSLEWLVPGLEAPTVRFTYELVNGENDTVLSGSSSDDLAHVFRIASFLDTSESSFLELGASALLGRATTSSASDSRLFSVDALFKWRPNDARQLETSFVAQVEAFFLDRDLGSESVTSAGFYGTLLYQVDRNWYLGVRGDWTQFPDVDQGDAWSASGWVSYYTTEFLRIRAGIEYLDDPRQPETDWQFFLQLTVVIGSHPAEPYWVNR